MLNLLTHIVFFKLKDRSPEAVERTAEVLRNMKGRIPELLDIEVGKDIVHSERSYDLALVTKFKSLSDMNAYQAHPVHQGVLAHMREVLDSPSVCVDYEG
ncbi:stress responsive A/B barrel domain protein [Paenibacillus larvae subsp. larvae DSM 25430]|uniref:Stress responsive A/B barrel domain protein n=1 Tax=Paenibacillus larvae subsp. larvae DSM 25430 TaxID=697284 RepID=V9W682_9BACL|nr:stress responsive A/B barrel domain protein [Paenibacillus larvae subsp. larvae DSM 25430]